MRTSQNIPCRDCMKMPQRWVNRLSMRRVIAAYTRTLRRSHIASRSLFAHPAVVANRGKGAFHYSPTCQELKSPWWQELVPIGYLAFLGQFLSPAHQHFFGGGFARTFDQFHWPS